jgi:hypothetical protein
MANGYQNGGQALRPLRAIQISPLTLRRRPVDVL